jgi:hypothetical protein
MNKQRSAKARKVLEVIAAARATMEAALDDLRGIRDDLAESLDNMSDGAREGESGQIMAMDHDALEELIDTIDGFDLKTAIDDAAQNLDIEGTDVPEARLDAAEMEERRMRRLPKWAADRIAAAEKTRDTAIEQAEKVFGVPLGEPEEFVIWRQHGPFKGRLIPTEIVEVPELGLKLRVQRVPGLEKKTWGLEIMAERNLMIRPQAGNMAFICGERW